MNLTKKQLFVLKRRIKNSQVGWAKLTLCLRFLNPRRVALPTLRGLNLHQNLRLYHHFNKGDNKGDGILLFEYNMLNSNKGDGILLFEYNMLNNIPCYQTGVWERDNTCFIMSESK